MKIDLFTYEDYKDYLNDYTQEQERGFKLKLAEAAQCQPSYLSQVLKGSVDFTMEQAFLVSRFLAHTPVESKYFLLLVEISRSGHHELKVFFHKQLDEIKLSRQNLKKRLSNTDDIPEEAQHVYYSSWIYAAIHVALSTAKYNSPKELAERFHLPKDLVVEVINFLESIGLIEVKKGIYQLTKKSLYLGKNSVFVQRHHINWRSQSLQSVEKNLTEDFHYSNVTAIAKKDFEKIKELYIQTIEKSRQIIGPSKEEEVYAITLDVFKL